MSRTLKVTGNHFMTCHDHVAWFLRVIVSSSRALWCLPSVKKQKHDFFFASFPRPWLFWISPKPNLIIVYTRSVGINTSDISYTNNLAEDQKIAIPTVFFFYFSVPIDLRRTPPFYTAVHSTVSKVLNSNGYSEVNLSKLFSAFFV